MFDLKNKIVIVTGSNTGNGLAISEGLKKANARVIGIDIQFDLKDEYSYELDLTNTNLMKELIDDVHLTTTFEVQQLHLRPSFAATRLPKKQK